LTNSRPFFALETEARTVCTTKRASITAIKAFGSVSVTGLRPSRQYRKQDPPKLLLVDQHRVAQLARARRKRTPVIIKVIEV